jgi:hypothetical protein
MILRSMMTVLFSSLALEASKPVCVGWRTLLWELLEGMNQKQAINNIFQNKNKK